MNNGWDMGEGNGLWVLGGMLLIVVILVLAVWAVTVASGKRHADHSSQQRPLDILSERFARGEITQQEFEQAKKTLGS